MGNAVCVYVREESSRIYVYVCVCVCVCVCVSVSVCACVPTSKSSQQDLLVKRHGALVCAAHHVPHCLINGKSSEGVGHLRGEERRGEERRGEERRGEETESCQQYLS